MRVRVRLGAWFKAGTSGSSTDSDSARTCAWSRVRDKVRARVCVRFRFIFRAPVKSRANGSSRSTARVRFSVSV
jgi:hypothetical protein